MSEEQWKPVSDQFPGYEASTLGRIRSYRRRGGGRSAVPRLLVLTEVGNYAYVSLRDVEGNNFRWGVHRFVMLAFHGPPPDDHIICHRNDVGTDNRLENLYYGTWKENRQDYVRNRKRAYPEHLAMGELTFMTFMNRVPLGVVRGITYTCEEIPFVILRIPHTEDQLASIVEQLRQRMAQTNTDEEVQ